MMSVNLSIEQIEKLGNTMIYLSKNVGEFGITKALKILFLLEENSIRKHGIPFFGFDFKVWQYGPVVEPVYFAVNADEENILSKYVKKTPYGDEFLFEAVADFNDDEFSQNDMVILEEMVKFAKHKTAYDFVKFTHGENSLWRRTATEKGIIKQLENKKLSTTDILIDFSPLFEDNEFAKERYIDYKEFKEFNNYIKA